MQDATKETGAVHNAVQNAAKATESEAGPKGERRNGIALSDALIIALLTFSGYCYVFAYEAGYCDLYHIPWDLISLNLTTGIVAALGIGAATLNLIYYWSPRFHSALFRDDTNARQNAYTWTGVFISNVLVIRTYNPIVLILFDGFLVLVAKPWIIKRRKLNPNAERSWTQNPSVFDELFSRLSPRAHLLVALALVSLVAAYAIGRSNAKTDPRYIITEGASPYIVLRIYGDNIIAAPIEHRIEPYQMLWWKTNVNAIVVENGLHFFKLGDPGLPTLVSRKQDEALISAAQQPTPSGLWGWLAPYR